MMQEILLDLYKKFKASPNTLAQQYCKNPTTLTEFELDRIRCEGTFRTLMILIRNAGIHDPLTHDLAKGLQINLDLQASTLSKIILWTLL